MISVNILSMNIYDTCECDDICEYGNIKVSSVFTNNLFVV